MAAMMVDERAPGVSSALRKRIAAALDAGERPSLQKKNLRLGSVVLQRSDGRDAPALQEVAIQMARRGLDTAGAFNTFLPSAYVRGHKTYAVDVAGLSMSSLAESAGKTALPRPGSASTPRATVGTSSTCRLFWCAAAQARGSARTTTT